MPGTSAIGELAELPDGELFPAISEGVSHLVTNLGRLHQAATGLAADGDHTSAAILGSIGTEEAAKALMLLDVVRCPPSRGVQRRRTLACWNSHLWKGLYARICDDLLAQGDFGDVQRFIERERSRFYLDGPTGADWVFPNEILSEREGRMYVDFVRDVTGADGGTPPWWSTPSPSERHSPASCLYLVDALVHVGATSVEGLEVVACVWRGFEPLPHTSREELSSLIGETVRELEAKGGAGASAADARLLDTVHQWPFPLWPLAQVAQDGSRTQQLHETRRERTPARDDPRHRTSQGARPADLRGQGEEAP